MTLSAQASAQGEVALGPLELLGRSTSVLVDDSVAGRSIRDELSLYRQSSQPAERVVRVTHHPPPDGVAVNPAIHSHLDDGFVARYPNAAVRFRFDGERLAEVTMHLPTPLRGIRAWRSQWRSIQFAGAEEASSQALHELALVPALYLDFDRLPVHASAFSIPEVGMVIVGGTGGVGKTTLALDLCSRFGASFAADDIAVLDDDGRVHPNLAYPKIYAYNVAGDDALRTKVLGSSHVVERLQWRWREARRGPGKVRRRVSPLVLYGSVASEAQPARRYLMIVREHRSAIAIDEVPAARAAEMSAAVLQAEYDIWHRQLSWHAYNALAIGEEPRVRVVEWFQAYEARAARALASVQCSVARVPIGLEHATFRRELVAVLKDR
jgi:hypothetical protein